MVQGDMAASPSEIKANIAHLLDKLTVQESSACKMCGRPLWYIADPKTGVVTPITDEADNHNFACPGAERYRGERLAQRGVQSSLFATNKEAF